MDRIVMNLCRMLFIGIFFILIITPYPCQAGPDGTLSISIFPPLIELEANPNEIIKTALKVSNEDKIPRTFRVKTKGIALTKKGLEDRPLSSLEPDSLSRNINIQEELVTIPPKSSKEIPISIMVNANLTGTHYSKINVSHYTSDSPGKSNKEEAYKQEVGVTMLPSMDVLVRLNLKGTLHHAHKIKKIIIISKKGNRPLNAEAHISNTGNAELAYALLMILLDKNQKVVSRMKTDGNVIILPGITGIVHFLPPLRDVPPGKYRAIITAVAEGVRLPPLEKDIEIH